MAKERTPIKINDKHQGKEFVTNWFHFIGKVKPVRKKDGDTWVDAPLFEKVTNANGKTKHVLQFIIETAEKNELRILTEGWARQKANLYSSKDRQSASIAWNDRFDKSKYPNDTYHLMDNEWDLTERVSTELKFGDWVEVKGKYDFNSFTGSDGNEINMMKRKITSLSQVENGQEIKLSKDNTITYITDFNSPDFVEVNKFSLQVGVKSTYQDEETNDVTVNAVFLSYGKERSQVGDLQLKVYAKDHEKLATAFTNVNKGEYEDRYDVLTVIGVDNNRAEKTLVAIEDNEDYNPFANIDEKVVKYKEVVSGSRKGLEIVAYVQGSLLQGALSQEDISKPEAVVTYEAPKKENNNPFAEVSGVTDEDLDNLPF